MTYKVEILVTGQVGEIVCVSRDQIINGNNLVVFCEESVTEM
jgi:hypothetical protein